MAASLNMRLDRYDDIAEQLLSLVGESSGLQKKKKKSYIVLERKLGKSDLNKNAISLKREGVSFMLSDWTAEAKARSLGLSVGRDRDFPRLIFPDLELSKVVAFSAFFSCLTKEAALHSAYLQSAGRHEKS